MEKWGREMVRYCAGLPLAIVILGGILVTKPSLIEWEKVYNDSLASLKKGEGFGENPKQQLFYILAKSYNDLPPQLKPCFLYLGKFMEDEWIDAVTLYQLWIAEGMVLSCDRGEGETMMQVAESYMGELVHMSMVQVRFNDLGSSLTKYKSCSLHDLMRDLSLYQAKIEIFFEAIDLRKGNDFHSKHSTVSPFANTRQLVVYESDEIANPSYTKRPSHQQYRSVLYINVGSISIGWPPGLGSYLAHFKFLRVLALEKLSLGHMGRVLCSLVYLRYLSLRGSELRTFPWIYKLVLLQTLNLDVDSFIDKPPVSSNGLGKLTFLHHLYLPYCDSRSGENLKLRFNGLSKLETLENFSTKWCEVKDLSKLSRLRRLTLEACGYDDLKETLMNLSGVSCVLYLALDIWIDDLGLKNDPDMIRHLFWNDKFKLGRLAINGKLPKLSELFEQSQQLNHTRNDVPLNCITKIQLRHSGLEEDPMPLLEKIPTLRDLSLSGAYKGKVMVCSAMGFPELTHLTLWSLDSLEIWKVEEGSMPILKDLTIGGCTKLEKLPKGIIFLRSLQRLVLYYSSWKLCDSVQLENGEQGPDFYKIANVPDFIMDYVIRA